eukprot:758684-Hanusia_phi.AAC.10
MSCSCPLSSAICTRQSENRKCLIAAVEQGSDDIIQYLFEVLKVGNIEEICGIRNEDGNNFLMLCVIHQREKILQYVLERMEDKLTRKHLLDQTDQSGNTALILASSLGYVNIAESLLRAGASLRIRNKRSIDAIQEAKDRQNIEMLKYLLQVQAGQQTPVADERDELSPDLSSAVEALQSHPCFAHWDQGDLQLIARESQYRQLLAGGTVVSNLRGTLILVLRGEVHLDQPQRVIAEKNVIWDPFFERTVGGRGQLTCATNTTIMQIPDSTIHRVVRTNPSLLSNLVKFSIALIENMQQSSTRNENEMMEFLDNKYASKNSSFEIQNSPARRRLQEVPLIDDPTKIKGIRDWNGVMRNIVTYEEKYNKHETDGVSTYLKCCMTLGIRPIYPVLHDLQSGRETLALQGVGMTSTQTQAVSAAVMNSNVLTIIDMSNNPITDSGCVGHKKDTPGILDALAANRRIQCLNLSQTCLTHSIGKALGRALENHPLRSFDISSNHLGDKGIEYLSNILSTCYLEELNLSNNRISNAGAISLGKALQGNLTLKILDLSWNHILQQGSIALFQNLQENSYLEELSLNWNYIGYGGGMAMTEMLKRNGKLRFLDVSNCNLPEECSEEICDSLKANSALSCIIMRWNPLRKGVKQIMQVAKVKGLKAHVDHCGLNSIDLQSDMSNASCLTGPYEFDLAIHQHRSNLKVLIEHGYHKGGENWRNERLDEQNIAINWNDKLSLPDQGILRFDFIDLEISDAPAITREDFKRLRKMFLQATSNADRMFLIREACGTFTFESRHVITLLEDVVDEKEKIEHFIALFSRLRDRERQIPVILLSCFNKPSVEILQRRLGPGLCQDSFRMFGNYEFDLSKTNDVKTLYSLFEIKQKISGSYFQNVKYAKLNENAQEASIDDYLTSQSRPENGFLRLRFSCSDEKKAQGGTKSLLSSSRKLDIKRKMKFHSFLQTLSKAKREETHQGAELDTKVEAEEVHFDFQAFMNRRPREYKLVVILAEKGLCGVVKAEGMVDKPFDSRFDGGKTVILLTLEDSQSRREVVITSPRGTRQYQKAAINWSSPPKTVLQVQHDKAAAVGAREDRREILPSQASDTILLLPDAEKRNRRPATSQDSLSGMMATRMSLDFEYTFLASS